MVKVLLNTSKKEELLTNLYNQEMIPTIDFKDLYFKRWNFETSYSFDKNILKIEEFSEQSVQSTNIKRVI